MDEISVGIGWVVSPFITSVINKITTFIENKFFKKAGIEDDMKKMKTILTEILSVMGTVEKQKIHDLNQAQLVQEIKDSVYDAVYIMDEFEYYLLEEKSKKQENTVSHVTSSSSHAIYQFIVGNKKFNKKAKEVSESLNRAKVPAQTLFELIEVTNSENLHVHECENWHVASSLISDKIIGREEECADLIDLLLQQSDSVFNHNFDRIIAIVGEEGIGKTTLAQMVFNDQRIQGHFDPKIWLTVSNNDMLSLTREMLKCVCKNLSNVDFSFEMLRKKLETELSSKKILVVLDDVSRDIYVEWRYKLLFPLLRITGQGSKICKK